MSIDLNGSLNGMLAIVRACQEADSKRSDRPKELSEKIGQFVQDAFSAGHEAEVALMAPFLDEYALTGDNFSKFLQTIKKVQTLLHRSAHPGTGFAPPHSLVLDKPTLVIDLSTQRSLLPLLEHIARSVNESSGIPSSGSLSAAQGITSLPTFMAGPSTPPDPMHQKFEDLIALLDLGLAPLDTIEATIEFLADAQTAGRMDFYVRAVCAMKEGDYKSRLVSALREQDMVVVLEGLYKHREESGFEEIIDIARCLSDEDTRAKWLLRIAYSMIAFDVAQHGSLTRDTHDFIIASEFPLSEHRKLTEEVSRAVESRKEAHVFKAIDPPLPRAAFMFTPAAGSSRDLDPLKHGLSLLGHTHQATETTAGSILENIQNLAQKYISAEPSQQEDLRGALKNALKQYVSEGKKKNWPGVENLEAFAEGDELHGVETLLFFVEEIRENTPLEIIGSSAPWASRHPPGPARPETDPAPAAAASSASSNKRKTATASHSKMLAGDKLFKAYCKLVEEMEKDMDEGRILTFLGEDVESAIENSNSPKHSTMNQGVKLLVITLLDKAAADVFASVISDRTIQECIEFMINDGEESVLPRLIDIANYVRDPSIKAALMTKISQAINESSRPPGRETPMEEIILSLFEQSQHSNPAKRSRRGE